MTHSDKAIELFNSGYNCAQSTAAAFASDFGLEREAVLSMTAGFGGGFGGLRETCGAVSAMTFLAGLHYGSYPPEDTAAKKELYDLVKRLHGEFRERFGTTNCRELLQKASVEPKSDPSDRNAEYYARRPCARFVAAAAEILDASLPPVSGRGSSDNPSP